MTLITYPMRVHFADDVLEEVLHSELQRVRSRRVLLVFGAELAEGELADRVRSGVPRGLRADALCFAPGADLRDLAAAAAGEERDTIIAFGSARAIELGRRCRLAQVARHRARPDLFAVPGIDGLPSPSLCPVESARAGLPSVIVLDPTVASGAGQGANLRTSVLSLIRCVESYLAQAFNPPADGMALDGLSRSVAAMPRIGRREGGIALHRELMAASLNAVLSQEKGTGPAQVLSILLSRTGQAGDEAAIARLVLPGLIRTRAVEAARADVLRKVLGDTLEPLDRVLRKVLSDAALPATLTDIGIDRAALDGAARAVTGMAGLTFGHARDVLEEVYEDA